MGTYQSVTVGPSCTCGADISQIEIGGTTVGIAGLRAFLAAFQAAGRAPDPSLADELLAMVKVYNYVAPVSSEEYKSALLREYTAYWSARLPHDSASASPPVSKPAAPEQEGAVDRIVGAVRRLFRHRDVGAGVDR